jgi:type IV secretion system protein VirB9
MLAVAAGGCSSFKNHTPEEFVAAVPVEEAKPPVEIVEVPAVLALPGQLKPLAAPTKAREPRDPKQRVVQANSAARMEPTRRNFVNATQVWPYSADALYQVYASPERITDISLQEGEQLTSVSAGDTVRWVIGDTTSGVEGRQRVHILVKPTRPDLKTNLVIHTDRRSYHLELTSTADAWMASASWEYPLDRLSSLSQSNLRAQAMAPISTGLALEKLSFAYRISGDSPSWKPVRAFDDGSKVYIQFPEDIGQGELPPLFVLGETGDAELVNYRVRTPYYVVDRLFSRAELRLGSAKSMRVVRISRLGKEGGRR